MAQIVTITNPLTGQPAQVDQLEHTAQQIDDGIGFESTDYPGCYYRTVDGVTEWFNPPMQLGGMDADGNPINEYRTTERYLGKPVYVKLVDCGALPNATYKDVQFAGSEARPISVSCTSGATACTATLPTMASGGAFGDGHKIDVSLVNYNQIRIVSDVNRSGDICYALVKYWKTTD